MLLKFVSSLSLLCGVALATPLERRQMSMSAVEGPSASSGSASGSASASMSAASGVASAAPVYAYSCTPNSSLTYVIERMAYPQYTLEQALPVFYNWTGAFPANITQASGSNTTGSSRTYIFDGQTRTETLTSATANSSTGSLDQVWTTGQTPGLIQNDTTNFALYRNSSNGETTIQVFANLCAYNQSLVAAEYVEAIGLILGGYGQLIGAAASAAAPLGSASASASGASAMSMSAPASASASG